MSSISISSSTFSASSKTGKRGGGCGFASILIVVLLILLSSWQEQELQNVVPALQIVQRLSSPSFFHNQSSTASAAAPSPSPSSSNLWVSSSQEDEDNRSIENLLSIPSSSSFDNGYSSSSGFNNLEKELFDPVRLTRLCDDDRSHS
eukprot:CAMPEP_0171008212 /NCGR_PEP_ID=MMETSP0736-20130129/20382_1 /TAXON_ID=186038 /ORGANISM="Fragilariopsis kerguelensis, Strain L26-C5" /LENGTH=146 /DNA_ID=CAMNT_0011439173 /DNA_START=13 /DNA_END=450 /DNA_ORIENTATION=-